MAEKTTAFIMTAVESRYFLRIIGHPQQRYAVKYETDGGELIEVWTPGKDVLVLEGMHGLLTYSSHPEKILNFRVVEQKSTK